MGGSTRQLDQLQLQLVRLDGKNYGAYKSLKGRWASDGIELCIDHVQGDPFASPTRVRLRIDPDVHRIEAELRQGTLRHVATSDFLLRVFGRAVRGATDRSGSGHSGKVIVDVGDDCILQRSGCGFDGDILELRFRVGLPARGRRILGRAAGDLLCQQLPTAARAVNADRLDLLALMAHIASVEDHAALTEQLSQAGLVAFVGNGSVLPRLSGVSTRPLPDAVPFTSPPQLEVELSAPHAGPLRGMGLPKGVSLITGGGFHGKTTLLEAIQFGVYPHVVGDGRERVATDPTAVKVRSEDGRSVVGVDLSPFISDLPGGRSTRSFTTGDASGSTSLAAAIVESLEVGATTLLLDEDTAATNLLIRDARMQELVQRETITPLIDRVRGLFSQRGVSTVLVVGGSGDYLEVADTVVLMQDYSVLEVSERAQAVVARHPTSRAAVAKSEAWEIRPRRPRLETLDPSRSSKGRGKVRARGTRELRFGDDTVDLSALEQLVDDSQARSIGVLLQWIGRHADAADVSALVHEAVRVAEQRGLYALDPLPELAAVRPMEVAAALNRLRPLQMDD
jgi:predicted ABC-class ATPase